MLRKERRNRPQPKPRLPLAPVVGVAASDTSQALSLQNDPVAAAGSNALCNTSQQQAVDSAESGKRGAGPETGQPDETSLVCKFHSGRVVNRVTTNARFFLFPFSTFKDDNLAAGIVLKSANWKMNRRGHAAINLRYQSRVPAVNNTLLANTRQTNWRRIGDFMKRQPDHSHHMSLQ